jgi:Domain of unknown function (DUF4332)
MTDLKSIPGIGKSSIELLEAAGFFDVESLAKAGVDELTTELERANKILQITKHAPVRGSLAKWIASARTLAGEVEDAPRVEEMPVNHEISPKVASLLAAAPFAIPLPVRAFVEQSLAVGDIPPAILLNRYCGDLEVRVEERLPGLRPGRPPLVAGNNVMMADVGATRREIDVSRIKSTDILAGGFVKPVTAKAHDEDDRVALIRGPRVQTNAGRSPKSRFFIRGVMHSHPHSMAAGAAITLLLIAILPISIISSALLLLSSELPDTFGWVPVWLLVVPCILPVLGVLYLVWGLQGCCRICGQRLFVPKVCLKNSKAHHVVGLGHIIPTCFHMLVFKWFRCTYCGTPVRLKK